MEYRTLGAVVCLSEMLGCTAIQTKLREPGSRLMDFPEAVASEYECAKRRLPFVKVEESELSPKRLRPGAQLSHHFVYVMCPSIASEVINGTLHTEIRVKGKAVYRDSVKQELQPGRWRVDTFITLPEQAELGMYALATRFESSKGRFSFHSDFLVEPGRALLSLH